MAKRKKQHTIKDGQNNVFDLLRPTEPRPPRLMMAVGDLQYYGGNELGTKAYSATFKVAAYHVSDTVITFQDIIVYEEPTEEPGKPFLFLPPESSHEQLRHAGVPEATLAAVTALSNFLLVENQRREDSLGPLSRIFAGGEVAYQCEALAWYAKARGISDYAVGVPCYSPDKTVQYGTVHRSYFGFPDVDAFIAWPFAEFEVFFEQGIAEFAARE